MSIRSRPHRTPLLVVLLLTLVLPPAGARAQQPAPQVAISVEAGYGFGNAYQAYQWFPVTVTIANDGADLQGVLEWRFPAQPGEGVFQLAVDLPRGSRKRVTLGAFSRDFARNGEVRLLVDGRAVLAQDVRLDPKSSDVFLVGVVSSDPSMLNGLTTMIMQRVSGTTVVQLPIERLPDRVPLLLALNALFIHDADTSTLSSAQRDALAQWVRQGGQLVVSGGANADRTTAGLGELLPVLPPFTLAQGSLAPLQPLAGVPEPPREQGALATGPLRPEVQALADGLISRWDLGAGTVWYTAFDVGLLETWTGRDGNLTWDGQSGLWQNQLELRPRLLPGPLMRQQRDNPLEATLQIPELGLPSPWALLLFLGIYVAAVGPLTLIILSRMRRRELAWITIPVTILLFTAFTYLVGVATRGTSAQILQVAVVQGYEGASQAHATAFTGVFSPTRRSYNLRFDGQPLVSQVRTWEDSGNLDSPIVFGDTSTNVPGVLVDVSSLRTFMVEQAVDLPLAIQSGVTRGAGVVRGELRNTGAGPLQDALIVSGQAAQELGTITPGATVGFELLETTTNFPWNTSAATEGTYNRQQFLIRLFGPPGFGPGPAGIPNAGLFEDQGVYLLAWGPDPVVATSVDGQTPREALALYIIRLNG